MERSEICARAPPSRHACGSRTRSRDERDDGCSTSEGLGAWPSDAPFRPEWSGKIRSDRSGFRGLRESWRKIERESASIDETVGRFENRLFGVVRITSVPMIVNRILVPRLTAFRAARIPGVTVELVPDPRNLSLSKREADLALRLARPDTGGLRTKAQKIGRLVFAVYRPAMVSNDDLNDLEWIGYDDAYSHLPQARWLAAASRGSEPSFPLPARLRRRNGPGSGGGGAGQDHSTEDR